MKLNLLANDLDYILQHTQTVWDELKNQRILITGGTGFFGTWLLEAIAWANQKYDLNLSVVVLTRNSLSFAKKAPHLLNNPILQFHVGDVRDYVFPEGFFSHVIHAATEANAQLNQEAPQLMLDTIVQGTRHTLDCARHAKSKKILFVSSGAVYGKQPHNMDQIHESYQGKLDIQNSLSAYAVGKLTAEQDCFSYASKHQCEVKIARCFAFVGPYLPIHTHFAIGNFIRDGLLGGIIHVNGDGTPFRSYLYAADLVIWLLKVLCHGKSCVPYNIGSDEAIAISDLAKRVAECFHPQLEVKMTKLAEFGQLPERYVPSVRRIKSTLGVNKQISLVDSIKKTIAWHVKQREENL